MRVGSKHAVVTRLDVHTLTKFMAGFPNFDVIVRKWPIVIVNRHWIRKKECVVVSSINEDECVEILYQRRLSERKAFALNDLNFRD